MDIDLGPFTALLSWNPKCPNAYVTEQATMPQSVTKTTREGDIMLGRNGDQVVFQILAWILKTRGVGEKNKPMNEGGT